MNRSILLTLGILAAASVGARADQPPPPNNLFTASGFVVRPADSPEKLELLRTFPADKLAVRRKGGKTYYVYADPNGCRCAYVGTPEAFAAYRNGGTTVPFVPSGDSPPDYVRDVEDGLNDDALVATPGSVLGNILEPD